jgi:hypothetical protein
LIDLICVGWSPNVSSIPILVYFRQGFMDHKSVLHGNSGQPLRAWYIHRLHIAVQLLLGAFLVVSLSRDPHAQSIGYAFDAGFPDFFVQLRVETDVDGSLFEA